MIKSMFIRCSCGHGTEIFCELPIDGNQKFYCIQCGKENKIKLDERPTLRMFKNLKK